MLPELVVIMIMIMTTEEMPMTTHHQLDPKLKSRPVWMKDMGPGAAVIT